MSRLTISTINVRMTAPERKTTLMLRAATSPLSTGLVAEPTREALVRNPNPTP